MIEIKNIVISFGGQIVFKDFSMVVKRGEKVLLSAPSGSGKSTLLKTLLGFQKPDSGSIAINNKIICKATLQEIRTSISYVSQDVELGNRTGQSMIDQVFSFKYNKHIKYESQDIEKLGLEFGLPKGFLKKNINHLSGGERQRFGFLICMLLDRDIWILDEVTSGLDHDLREQIINKVLLSDKTVIISSHDDIWKSYEAIRVVTW